jgi:GNAT superfamily N-acetyltransferase
MQHELEWIERQALVDLNRALAGKAVSLGRASRALGTTYVSAFAAMPPTAITLNRTIGLGLEEPADDRAIEAVLGVYAEAGITRYFIHVHPEAEPRDLHDRLKAKGLAPARAWVKLSRGRERPPPAPTRLEVRRAGPADAAALGRIAADAFDLGDAGTAVLRALIGRPNWHVFMTAYDGVPAGCGTLYVEDRIGWLDWGATSPDYRGLNGQSALLRHRIVHALDLDCRLLASCTGEEVPGEPQISYRNLTKMGFTPAYTRRNIAPPRPQQQG